ncbi:hypothetical protein M413DRAFT_111950 [Hebeloma cylindrosporum]|uniref:Uncharacterized protein n=1 Tax=Hebeloma cylindrosporum TaxID=76867 RepID=A0A0C3CLK1_HEBCY|nr:hypothetical protein M413DRAFT_111950 [Hebeloma cylindrosporum h7]
MEKQSSGMSNPGCVLMLDGFKRHGECHHFIKDDDDVDDYELTYKLSREEARHATTLRRPVAYRAYRLMNVRTRMLKMEVAGGELLIYIIVILRNLVRHSATFAPPYQPP